METCTAAMSSQTTSALCPVCSLRFCLSFLSATIELGPACVLNCNKSIEDFLQRHFVVNAVVFDESVEFNGAWCFWESITAKLHRNSKPFFSGLTGNRRRV